MTLYEKSLKTLELPSVLEMLAAQAVSEDAKEAAMKLAPSADIEEIRRRLGETTAAGELMSLKGSPSLSGIKNISGAVARSEIGGMLNTRELLDVAGLLRCARTVISYATGDRVEKHTCIDYLFSSLRADRVFEERITNSIIGDDELADTASPELADIRRHMRQTGEKVRQTLQKIISSPSYAKYLQEAIITMRNDRYVVPVKAEFKNGIPGLVHDISSSGATLFVEPLPVVQANNEIRELLSKEKAEVERILYELSGEVAARSDYLTCDYNVLTAIDLIFAKAKLSYKLDCCEPVMNDAGVIRLVKARHPMLPLKTAVPIDAALGSDYDTLVITGPNTGGKTVTLKTIGLLCVMAACGLHIPARDGSTLPVLDKVLADIGDEQSIEQSLSTFSSHMTNIVKMLGECGDRTLLLFDELGAGTDPVEGAALAISIIEYCRRLGALVAATTHYAELKIYATTEKGVQNASCEFDVETLMPTYHLLIGIPGKSNAFAISKRLGISDVIIEDAKKRIDSDSVSFEEVLESLEHTRQEMERERAETRRLLAEAEENAKKAEENRQITEKEREKAVKLAKREAGRILDDARKTADDVLDEINDLRKKAEKDANWQMMNDAKVSAHRKLNETEERLDAGEEEAPPPLTVPAKQGDTVEILSIGTRAQVISVNADGSLNLQAGIMKITAKQEEVRVTGDNTAVNQVKKLRDSAAVKLRSLEVKPELDIRGMMSDEAIPVVERYIDSALLAKLNTVTIIHGKGTGALRAAVQQSLKRNRQVKSFRLGRYGEGEIGVTVVELK